MVPRAKDRAAADRDSRPDPRQAQSLFGNAAVTANLLGVSPGGRLPGPAGPGGVAPAVLSGPMLLAVQRTVGNAAVAASLANAVPVVPDVSARPAVPVASVPAAMLPVEVPPVAGVREPVVPAPATLAPPVLAPVVAAPAAGAPPAPAAPARPVPVARPVPAAGAALKQPGAAVLRPGGLAAQAAQAASAAPVLDGPEAGAVARAGPVGDAPAKAAGSGPGKGAGAVARPGPYQDPKFGALAKDVQTKKRKVATSHPPARAEAGNAQGAARPPADDIEAQGKTANAEKMDAAEPKEFNKAEFIKAVEKAIAERAPKNLKEADEFGDSGKAEEVKQEVQGQVGEGKDASAKEIADTTAAPPDTSQAKEKQVVPLTTDRPPAAPGAPDANNAVPDKLPPSATDMTDEKEQANRQMKDAQVTEPQLRKSNEPQFVGAMDTKDTAERDAVRAQGQMRAHEGKTLAGAKADARGAGGAGMHGIAGTRVATGRQVGAGKNTAKGRDEDKRAKVTATLQRVFDATKKDVEDILSGLDKKVDAQFSREEKRARDDFTTEHKRLMKEYKDKRYSGWRGKLRWFDDWLTGLPDEADQIYVTARDHYLVRMRRVISDIADTVATELARAKDRIAKGRKDLQAEVKRLPADLRAIGREAAEQFADKFDELRQTVEDKGTELVDTLAEKYTEALKSVDGEIAAEKEKNKGVVQKAVDKVKGVIKTINELKNLLLGVLRKAGQAIMAILADPIGFLRNLVGAVGSGLKLFMKNIGRHLQTGLLSWLLGISARAGLQFPAKFDARGILLMIATLLGLSWAFIRGRLMRRVPPQAVAAAERGPQAVALVAKVQREGVGGLWDEIKGRVGDLKQTLMSKIIEYLVPSIIIAGITWVLSLLNPASAFVRACKLIIDIVRFVVERGRQVLEFVNAVLDAVIAIAKGGGGGVPALVERALARSIPVLIGFLAAILGIGGIADKVKKIFQTLSRPVARAIDWIIDKITTLLKHLWTKLKAKFARKPGKRARKDPGKRAKKQPDKKAGRRPGKKAEVGAVGEDLVWTVRAEFHHLWIGKVGGRYVPMMASERAHPVKTAIASYKRQAEQLAQTDEDTAKDAKAAIARADVGLDALMAALARYEAKSKAGASRENFAGERVAVKGAQKTLRDAVAEVQRLLGHDDERVKRAKEEFESSPFSTSALVKLLGVSDRHARRIVQVWVNKGIVFRLQSDKVDPEGKNTFDPTVAGWREIDPNNRHKYGYVNPSKTSGVGLIILSKGLLGSLDSRTGAWKAAVASEETDARYHQQFAHYKSVVNPGRYPDFQFPEAILGHAPPGASGHWNRVGHQQTREANHAWNQQPSSYHGPEHKEESAASGSQAKRYELPTKERGSHSSWWEHG